MLAVTSGRVKGIDAGLGDACASYRAGDICNLCMDAACVQCIPVREWIYGVHICPDHLEAVSAVSTGPPFKHMLTDFHWT